MADIRRVAYAYNSALEKQDQKSYFLDCYVSRDGETVVDVHETYRTRDEFFRAIENVIPIFADNENTES